MSRLIDALKRNAGINEIKQLIKGSSSSTGEDMNARDEGYTVLMHAVKKHASKEIAAYLIKKGTRVNDVSTNDNEAIDEFTNHKTALMLAVIDGNIDLVKTLIDHSWTLSK